MSSARQRTGVKCSSLTGADKSGPIENLHSMITRRFGRIKSSNETSVE